MKQAFSAALFGAAICFTIGNFMPTKAARAATTDEPAIIHDVYFSLKESNAENRQKLVDACKKLLTGHENASNFSVGVVSDALKRPVNDRDWDVGLHITFKNKAAHDTYSDSPRHKEFVEGIKGMMSKVRVFDTAASP